MACPGRWMQVAMLMQANGQLSRPADPAAAGSGAAGKRPRSVFFQYALDPAVKAGVVEELRSEGATINARTVMTRAGECWKRLRESEQAMWKQRWAGARAGNSMHLHSPRLTCQHAGPPPLKLQSESSNALAASFRPYRCQRCCCATSRQLGGRRQRGCRRQWLGGGCQWRRRRR